MRLAGRIEDRDRPVTIEPISKIQSGESKGVFALSAIIGGTKSGKVLLGIWRVSQRKAIMLVLNISELVRHPALLAKRKKCCVTNPDVWYQTAPTFVAR